MPAVHSGAVIASQRIAKQSIAPHKETMDCFVASLLAMTAVPTRLRDPAARFARVVNLVSPPKRSEGAGKAGCALHPRSRVQSARRNAHTSIQVQRRASGLPCAMVLRLMARSPRRRIRLATVAAGLTAASDPVGSNAPPTAWHQQRVSEPHAFAVRFGAVRPARRYRSRRTRPATSFRADAKHVHRIPSRVRDDRETPLLPGRDGANW